MTAGEVVGRCVVVAVATVFLYAASFKLFSSGGLRRTIATLGVPPTLASAIAVAVPPFEVVLVLAVVGLAPPIASVPLVLLAAIGIGGAGALALQRGLSVPCSCFSSQSTAELGSRQLLFAGVLVVVAIMLFFSEPPSGVEESLAALAMANVVGLLAHLVPLLRDLTALAGYRRAAASEYPA